jgi:hypothetical protein
MPVIYTARGLQVQRLPGWLKPADIALNIMAHTSVFASPFTRTTQTVDLPGALFAYEASFAPIYNPDQIKELRAVSARSRGRAGRWLLPAYSCRYAPPLAGLPERLTWLDLRADNTVITADSTLIRADATRVQMETVFIFAGATSSTRMGGYLYFNSRRHPLEVGGFIAFDDATGWRHLHIVVDIDHNVTTGQAWVVVEPPLRVLPTPTTPMHVHAPAGIFQLTEDAAADVRQQGRMVSFSLSALQSFPLEVTA